MGITEEQSTCRTINIIHPDIKGIIESKLKSQHPKFPNFSALSSTMPTMK